MERTAAAVRMSEAIPTPVRVMGWMLIIGPVFALVVDGPGPGGQLRSLVDQGLAILGLGAGVGRAHMRSDGLGRKSSLVFVASLATQAMLFLLSNTA